MQLLFRRAHVGPLLDQLRGQADRQIGGQMQVRKSERFTRTRAGIDAGQRRDEIALLRECLAQRRQRCLGLRQSGFLRRQIAAIGIARVQLAPQCVAHRGVDRDELNCGVDLAAQRGFGDGRDGEVRRQRKIGRLDLEALHVGQGFERFDRSPIKPPDVERVRHRQLRGIEIE